MTPGAPRSRGPLAGAALALVLGASACGFSADAGTATAGTSTTAAAVAPEVDQVRVGDTVRAGELAGWTAAALRKEGTVRIEVTSGSRVLTGELDVRGGAPAYRIAGGSGADAVEVRWVGQACYLGGEPYRALTGGRRFLKVEPGGNDPMSRMLAPLLGTLRQAADPSALVARLGEVRATATAVDKDRVTWSLKVTAAQLEKATEALLGEPLPAQAVERLQPVTLEQTLDGDGRLLSTRQRGGGAGDTTVRYSDYGARVDIQPPAAADVGTARS